MSLIKDNTKEIFWESPPVVFVEIRLILKEKVPYLFSERMDKSLFLIIFLTGYVSARMDMCVKKQPPVMKDFDLIKLKGRWFEYARLPNIIQYLNKERCNTINMRTAGDGLKFTMSFINETSETRVSVEGNMTTNPDMPGKVLVHFFPVEIKDYITVVDAQYDNYVVFYLCNSVLYFKLEYAWVLTRQPKLSPEKKKKLMDKLSSMNIDTDRLEFENQTDC